MEYTINDCIKTIDYLVDRFGVEIDINDWFIIKHILNTNIDTTQQIPTGLADKESKDSNGNKLYSRS